MQLIFSKTLACRNKIISVLAISCNCVLILVSVSAIEGSTRSLGTIAGTVKDSQDRPLANAVVTIARDNAKEAKEAKEIVRQVRTSVDGSFTTKLQPGRYALNAFAAGFNSAVFDNVEVKSLERLVYLFRLEPATSDRTLPAQRKDRDDPRWRLRAAHAERSVFQLQDNADQPDETIA
ncbi:MAG: carboxypeptidase-like regulatory domain-containing protein, partial [Pyrinomonadaceae bacterium]